MINLSDDAPWPGMKNEEEIEEMKKAMREKVEGSVERGDPVEVHVRKYDDRPLRKYLTYHGWFRRPHRAFSGEMEKCMKEEADNEDGFILCDLQCSSINPDNVEKIVPLTPVKRTKTNNEV